MNKTNSKSIVLDQLALASLTPEGRALALTLARELDGRATPEKFVNRGLSITTALIHGDEVCHTTYQELSRYVPAGADRRTHQKILEQMPAVARALFSDSFGDRVSRFYDSYAR